MDYELEKADGQSANRLEITAEMKSNLLTAAKWTKFLTVTGTIGVVVMVLFSFIIIFAGSVLAAAVDMGQTLGIGVTYVIVAATCVYPLKKGFDFVRQARSACENDNSQELAEMFATMKSVTKYCGVLTIVVLCMYALFFVGALGIVGSWA